VALWQGKYKDMGEGKETYCIPKKIWEKIGEETTVSSAMILSAFGHHTPKYGHRSTSLLLKTGHFG